MYQKILEELDDLIIIIDDNNNIIYTNKPKDIFDELIPINDNFYQGKNEKIYSATIKNIVVNDQNCKLYHYKENTKLYQIISAQRLDSITNIPNRTVVNQYLNKINSQENNSIIAMVDIDNFKIINDTYGHFFGDSILAELSSLLKLQIRETDFIGRYGGEEFIIILNSEKMISALNRFNNIRNKIEEHFKNSIYKVTISIGVSYFDKKDSIMEAVEKADQALYHVKKNGRNNVGFWNKDSNEPNLLIDHQTKMR